MSAGTGASDAVEHHLEVARTARYFTLGDLAATDVWFVLHGYKQLARRFIRRFEPIAGAARLVVAPEALSRFYVDPAPGRHAAGAVVGATWMTREDREHEIADYVRYLDRLARSLDAERRRVTVLGFSQGVATATRWVMRGAVRPARLLLWGDFAPPDLDGEAGAQALASVDVVLVRGRADTSLSPELAAEEAARLRAAGIAHRTVSYEGGHDVEAETLVRLASS